MKKEEKEEKMSQFKNSKSIYNSRDNINCHC